MEEMKPGRFMDMMVGDKIFGLKSFDIPTDRPPTATELTEREVRLMALPNYSTDIAAAMEVIAKVMPKYNSKISIETYDSHIWSIKPCGTSSASLPHAICLAALKAVEKLVARI